MRPTTLHRPETYDRLVGCHTLGDVANHRTQRPRRNGSLGRNLNPPKPGRRRTERQHRTSTMAPRRPRHNGIGVSPSTLSAARAPGPSPGSHGRCRTHRRHRQSPRSAHVGEQRQSTHVAVDLGGIFANAQFRLTRPRLGARSEPQTEAAVAAEVRSTHRLAVAAPNGAPNRTRPHDAMCGQPHTDYGQAVCRDPDGTYVTARREEGPCSVRLASAGRTAVLRTNALRTGRVGVSTARRLDALAWRGRDRVRRCDPLLTFRTR